MACWVGSLPQTAIGARHALALASKANFTYPADYYPAAQWLEADLAPPPKTARDPADGPLTAILWKEPGIGVDPDPELIKKYLVAEARLGPSQSPV